MESGKKKNGASSRYNYANIRFKENAKEEKDKGRLEKGRASHRGKAREKEREEERDKERRLENISSKLK